MLRKFVLVGVAVLALGATVAAATALAWTHGEAELEQNADFKVNGILEAKLAGGGSAELDVVMEGELMPGGEGQFKKIPIKSCKGTGTLAGVTCTGTINALPWKFEKLKDGSIAVKAIDFTVDFYGPNDAKHATLIGQVTAKGNFTWKPDNKAAMSSLDVDSSEITANGAPASLSGTFAVEPAGTYGTE